jgi:hypothetical protein
VVTDHRPHDSRFTPLPVAGFEGGVWLGGEIQALPVASSIKPTMSPESTGHRYSHFSNHSKRMTNTGGNSRADPGTKLASQSNKLYTSCLYLPIRFLTRYMSKHITYVDLHTVADPNCIILMMQWCAWHTASSRATNDTGVVLLTGGVSHPCSWIADCLSS